MVFSISSILRIKVLDKPKSSRIPCTHQSIEIDLKLFITCISLKPLFLPFSSIVLLRLASSKKLLSPLTSGGGKAIQDKPMKTLHKQKKLIRTGLIYRKQVSSIKSLLWCKYTLLYYKQHRERPPNRT